MEINSNSPIVKSLVDYGLNDKEAKIYLALIELDTATVNEIAHAADINRSSAYVVIEKLKKKGLVSTIKDYKIQRYVATNPEVLLQEAETRALRNIEIKNKIQNVVSELKSIHRETKKKPKIMVYEGLNGLINAFNDSLTTKEKRIRISSAAEDLSEPVLKYFKAREDLGISIKGIHPDTPNSRKLLKMSPVSDLSILIPKIKYCFSSDFAIYDEKIGFMSAKNGGWAVIIENKEMSDVMKSLFDLAFEEAKKLNRGNLNLKEKITS